MLAGLRAVPVPVDASCRLDLSAISDSDADGPWCCGSTRRATRPASSTIWPRGRAWGRARGVPVFSDECYAEFTWDGPARTILATGDARRGGRRALAVQALQPGRACASAGTPATPSW